LDALASLEHASGRLEDNSHDSRNAVKSDVLPFPFNIRQGMPLWNWLFFKKGDYAPDPTKSPEWNRGAYLVLGPGHCGACHTPKNFLGGDETSRALDGDQLQGWFAPNITGDRVIGIGGWSVEDIASSRPDTTPRPRRPASWVRRSGSPALT